MIMLFLMGCQPGAVGGNRKEPSVGYRTGSQGMVMNFLPNYPRAKMFADEPFDILLEIKNRGSFPIGYTGDKIYISGFDPSPHK